MCLRINPAAGMQRIEGRQGRLRAQVGMPPAGNELLGLDEELDLADAAATELDVVACDRDFAVAAMGVDLPLDRMDVRDRGVVEVFAPTATSPTQTRALIIAARSQFWPIVS